ncbi:LysM peptidoglycan-binding domain-containing protein [Candidatus Woesearchaeota archaeon]|nr:LysM peptidoglycan-binding domain-containing protein [Candidatus Woesearchaeota archaeon]
MVKHSDKWSEEDIELFTEGLRARQTYPNQPRKRGFLSRTHDWLAESYGSFKPLRDIKVALATAGATAGLLYVMATHAEESEAVEMPIDHDNIELPLPDEEGFSLPAPEEGLKLLNPEKHSDNDLSLENFVYEVQKGDSLSRIARRKGLTLTEIKAANPEIDHDNLGIGQRVNIWQASYVPEKPEKLDKIVNSDYKTLKSWVGIPYGPVYPKGKDKDKKHLDCISILYEFASHKGIQLTGDLGDKIYNRHTSHVATLNQDNKDLSGIRTGDLVFIGHPFPPGEGGISAWHNGIVGKPVYKDKRIVDFTMIHASGDYGEDRATQYWGRGVVEESLLGYLNRFRDNEHKDHMFVGRLKAAETNVAMR